LPGAIGTVEELNSETDPNAMFVFFDGMYMKKEPSPFPYVFTLGCLEIKRLG